MPDTGLRFISGRGKGRCDCFGCHFSHHCSSLCCLRSCFQLFYGLKGGIFIIDFYLKFGIQLSCFFVCSGNQAFKFCDFLLGCFRISFNFGIKDCANFCFSGFCCFCSFCLRVFNSLHGFCSHIFNLFERIGLNGFNLLQGISFGSLN